MEFYPNFRALEPKLPISDMGSIKYINTKNLNPKAIEIHKMTCMDLQIQEEIYT